MCDECQKMAKKGIKGLPKINKSKAMNTGIKYLMVGAGYVAGEYIVHQATADIDPKEVDKIKETQTATGAGCAIVGGLIGVYSSNEKAQSFGAGLFVSGAKSVFTAQAPEDAAKLGIHGNQNGYQYDYLNYAASYGIPEGANYGDNNERIGDGSKWNS